MAKIKEYTSRVDKLQPSDIGFSAYETAARRLQLLYGQAATETRQAATLQAGDIQKQASIASTLITDINRESIARRTGAGAGIAGAGRTSNPFPNGGGAGAAAQMTGLAHGLVVPQPGGELVSPPDTNQTDIYDKYGQGLSQQFWEQAGVSPQDATDMTLTGSDYLAQQLQAEQPTTSTLFIPNDVWRGIGETLGRALGSGAPTSETME